MAWDRTLPANSSKIRLSAGYIRSNWDAIEFGEVPYDKLQLQEQAGNPTQQDDTGWLYSKDVGGGTELFYMDSQATPNVIQLTSGGRIGTTNSIYLFDALSHNGTFFMNEACFISAWAYCSGAGGVLGGLRIAGNTRVSTGTYNITTTPVFANAGVAVNITPFRPGSATPSAANLISAPTFGGGVITIPIEIKDRNGNHVDVNFYVTMIYGLS